MPPPGLADARRSFNVIDQNAVDTVAAAAAAWLSLVDNVIGRARPHPQSTSLPALWWRCGSLPKQKRADARRVRV